MNRRSFLLGSLSAAVINPPAIYRVIAEPTPFTDTLTMARLEDFLIKVFSAPSPRLFLLPRKT